MEATSQGYSAAQAVRTAYDAAQAVRTAYGAAQAVRSGGRAPVRRALLAARQRTLALADAYAVALHASALQVRYDPALNPPLWELGHIGWFQEWWVGRNRQRALGTRCDPEHARAPSLLAQADACYDSGRVAHRTRWELPLPDAAGTRSYLAETLAQTLEQLDRLPVEVDATAADADADANANTNTNTDALYFFRLVALHEEMHAEAAIYMAPALGIELPDNISAPSGASGAGAFSPGTGTKIGIGAVRIAQATVLRLPAQNFRMGYDGPGFAFDNELGAHPVQIDACEIDATPVTWSQFLPFVAAGGYQEARWWDAAGWAWCQQVHQQAQPLPSVHAAGHPDAPAVHLNALEAEAWCRWAGRRLPTEAEWECAALTLPGFLWGHALGTHGVWEWTASDFEPYPGFVAHPYRDYSAPWFGSRRVLRGASHATAPALAHPRYRNFFEPQRSDIFAGFRSCA